MISFHIEEVNGNWIHNYKRLYIKFHKEKTKNGHILLDTFIRLGMNIVDYLDFRLCRNRRFIKKLHLHLLFDCTCSLRKVILVRWSPSPSVDGMKCSGISRLECGARTIGCSLSRSREKLLVLERVGTSSRVSDVGLSSNSGCFVHLGREWWDMLHIVQHVYIWAIGR